jgi:hypothetical protein
MSGFVGLGLRYQACMCILMRLNLAGCRHAVVLVEVKVT